MIKTKIKNPLSGQVYFDKDGNLLMLNEIKFGGEMNPKVKPREWFYLMFEACKEKDVPFEKVEGFIKSTLGSRATQWRIKNSLIKKGYL